MKDFEVSAEPVQDWLSKTEKMVRGSSDRLYDLPAKRREQQKLQVMRRDHAATSSPILCVSLYPCVRVPASTHPELSGAVLRRCPPSLFLTHLVFPAFLRGGFVFVL